MIKTSRKQKQLFIAIIDFMLLIVAIPIALYLRSGDIPTFKAFKIHLMYFSSVIVFWLICMYTAGFYILERPFEKIRTPFSLLTVALLSLVIGFSIFYVLFVTAVRPRFVLLIYVFVAYFLILFWRYLYNIIYFTRTTFPSVLFVGNNKSVMELIPQLKKITYFQYNPAAIFEMGSSVQKYPEVFSEMTIINNPDDFIEYIDNNKIDVVVLSDYKIMNNKIRAKLFSLLNKNILIYSIQNFYELTTRKVPLASLNDAWFLSEIDLYSKSLYLIFKRLFDILIAILMLLLFLPLILLVSIIIKFDSKGPVLFKQIREGKDGKLFSIFKFRTMKTEKNDFSQTIENDSRITNVGSFLRKTRIDEIPQMLNILKGDMSLIGPRPERPELAKDLELHIPFYRQRLLVKPGITGWDQISGEYHSPSVADTIKKMQYDLYYIKNFSFALDTSIFFKTITTVFKKTGR